MAQKGKTNRYGNERVNGKWKGDDGQVGDGQENQ